MLWGEHDPKGGVEACVAVDTGQGHCPYENVPLQEDIHLLIKTIEHSFADI